MADSILLIGADSQLGREFRDRFEESGIKLRLQRATLETEATAVFAATEDEIEVVAAVDAGMLEDARVVVATSHAAEALARLDEANSAAPLVDLTGALAADPSAILRAPKFEARGVQTRVHLVPQPGAWLLASFLDDLHTQHPVKHAVVTLFEPASQSGRQAIDELHKQTIALLSFKPLPKSQFDAQLSFNLLARLGEDAKVPFASRQPRLAAELAELARLHGGGLPVPSLRLIQAPVFHGYSASVWVEFASRPNLPALIEGLARDGVDMRGPDLDPPDAAGMAGQSGYAAGAAEPDAAHPNAAWFWVAADNLRLQAELALDVVRELV